MRSVVKDTTLSKSGQIVIHSVHTYLPTQNVCITWIIKNHACRQRLSPSLVRTAKRCGEMRTSRIWSHTKQRHCSTFFFFFLTPSKRITSAAIKLHKRQRHSINYIHRSRGLTWAAKSSAGGTVFTFIYQSIATAVLIYCCFPLSLSVAFVIPITGEARQQILRDTSLKNILHICHVFIISHTFCPSLFSLCSQTFVRLVSFWGGWFQRRIWDGWLVAAMLVWVNCLLVWYLGSGGCQPLYRHGWQFHFFQVLWTDGVYNRHSPDVILCGWLGLKHQLTN